ncbi:MAG: ATP-binding protein [Chloroflexota bacterium]
MNQPLKPLEEIGDQWFINRQEYLDFFWNWANSVPLPGGFSIAFAGLRRTGKTAILHRVFNRLFHEQDRVMPVFITFEPYLYRTEKITTYEFAEHYFLSYLRSYLAFEYKRPDIHNPLWKFRNLREFADEKQDKITLDLIADYDLSVEDTSPRNRFPSMELASWAINLPKGIAGVYHKPTAVFIDEFQILADVYDPDHDRVIPLTNYYQKPSESLVAPMVVSGSSVSLLLGRATSGALSGRLKTRMLGPLDEGHAVDMVRVLGRQLNIEPTEEFIYATCKLTQGYPFAIESLMTSASPATWDYPKLSALDEVVRFELTHPQGELFKHYNAEFHKYSKLLNDGQTTKKVMFWATQYPNTRVKVKDVAEKIGVKPQEVQEALQKLEELDVVQRMTWSVYHGPTEPMLNRYIKYQYQYEIEELTEEQAGQNIKNDVSSELRKMRNIMGRFAEIVVGAVMKGFDGRTLDGSLFFSTPEFVTVPRFNHIENRWGVIEDDTSKELDLIAEYQIFDSEEETWTQGAWFVQVKYQKTAVTSTKVQEFLEQIDAIQAVKGYDEVTRWYVSKGGYFEPALDLLEEEGIYYTDLKQFNELAQEFGFLGFPEKTVNKSK